MEYILFLLFKLDMSRVEVTIRYATLKKSQDTFGKMENYVKVKCNNGVGNTTEFKTKIIAGEKEKPITWNETFSATVRPGTGAQMEFLVMDEDMTSDDLCGKGYFRLDSCGVFGYGERNYNIQLNGNKGNEEAGSLHITTRFV